MGTKQRVYETPKLMREVSTVLSRKMVDCPTNTPGATAKKCVREIETAQFEGSLEVFLDIERLLNEYAIKAFQNKRARFVRGPIEVRVKNMAEIPGSRRKETKG